MRRMANKLAYFLANQGVICTDNRVAKYWKELPYNRLRAKCQDQADEDKTVFLNSAMEEGYR